MGPWSIIEWYACKSKRETAPMLRILFFYCLWGVYSAAAAAAQVKADSCDTYKHPQYGFGQCVNQNQCPNSLYVSGLCESQASNIQCCFSTQLMREEFRAIWIATVNNIDWPASKTATPAQQQSELIDILNTVQRLNMNAVIFQVSPCQSLVKLIDGGLFLLRRFVQPVMLCMRLR